MAKSGAKAIKIVETPITEAPVLVNEEKRGRGQLSEEARLKASESRHQRAIVNQYLDSIRGNATGERADKRAERLADVERMLEKGTKTKPVPVFEIADGKRKRTGTKYEERPLTAVEHAELLTEAKSLRAPRLGKRARGLRDEVLACLADFAVRQGYDRPTLIAIGFPEADLDAAGVVE